MNAIRSLALTLAIGLIVYSVITGNAVGRIVTAVWSDVITFCERQPQACAETRTLAADVKNAVTSDLATQPAIQQP